MTRLRKLRLPLLVIGGLLFFAGLDCLPLWNRSALPPPLLRQHPPSAFHLLGDSGAMTTTGIALMVAGAACVLGARLLRDR